MYIYACVCVLCVCVCVCVCCVCCTAHTTHTNKHTNTHTNTHTHTHTNMEGSATHLRLGIFSSSMSPFIFSGGTQCNFGHVSLSSPVFSCGVRVCTLCCSARLCFLTRLISLILWGCFFFPRISLFLCDFCVMCVLVSLWCRCSRVALCLCEVWGRVQVQVLSGVIWLLISLSLFLSLSLSFSRSLARSLSLSFSPLSLSLSLSLSLFLSLCEHHASIQ
jgi:hypothetical protein